jgi:hypothetical protein
MVKKFFQDVSKHESLADHETRSWLRNLPFDMRKDAIPLFVDGDDSEDDSKEYQLHPCYTFLEVRKTATQPHSELLRLYIDDNVLEAPDLIIGIGRLFVNYRAGEAGRTSKWTGYEVFVDRRLALWMVFDTQSLNPRAVDWYPLPCKLSHSISADSDDAQRALSYVSKERRLDIACFLPSLRNLVDANFKTAGEMVQKTRKSGKMTVGEVEQSEAEKLLQKEVTLNNGDEIPDDLRQAILDAVDDKEEDGQKIADLLDKYKENLSLIRKVITEEVILNAVRNEACGEKIMTILLQKFKDEVCKGISFVSVKAAVGNWRYGTQITGQLLNLCGEVVWTKMSSAAICAAAENEKCGSRILALLVKANEPRANKLIEEVYSRANKGEEWPVQVLKKLTKKLKEIGHPLGYNITSGRGIQQRSPVAKQSHMFAVRNGNGNDGARPRHR